MSLKPYQLLAYGNSGSGVPVKLSATAPAAVKRELAEQIAFAEKLLASGSPSQTFLPISPVELGKATKKLAEANTAFAEGKYVTARQLITHHFVVKLYEALRAWPPNLWQSKLPDVPPGAMLPQELKTKSVAGGATDSPRVTDLGQVAPSLAGEQALTWNGAACELTIDVPLLNRYRVSYGCLTQAPYSLPLLQMDGITIPGQDRPSGDNGLWSTKAIAEPFALTAGKHRLSAAVPPGKSGSLLFAKIQPFYRYVTANQWSVIGPFASKPQWGKTGTGMEAVLPPEGKTDLAAHYDGDAGESISWQIPKLSGQYVDLHKITGEYAEKVSFAVTYIESPEDRAVELDFGVDYWARLWLNTEKVFEVVEGHGYPVWEQFKVPVKLKKGWNELKIKVNAGSAGNGFWLAISDPGDLTIAPFPQTGG